MKPSKFVITDDFSNHQKLDITMGDDRRGSRLLLAEGIVLSSALFGATLLWFRQSLSAHKRKKKKGGASSFLERRHQSLSDLQKAGDGQVSTRGQAARIPPIPYLRQLFACFKVREGSVHRTHHYRLGHDNDTIWCSSRVHRMTTYTLLL